MNTQNNNKGNSFATKSNKGSRQPAGSGGKLDAAAAELENVNKWNANCQIQ